MRGLLILLFGFLLLFGCSTANNDINNVEANSMINNTTNEVNKMRISSPEFQNNGLIPKKFSCQGEDINPQLLFENVSDDAKSLVLIMDDPDAPGGTWVHWVLFNIPPDVTGILEDSVPDNAVQGLNSWPKNSYGGPCPPSGIHRYFFKLYALDVSLNLDESASKKDVEEAMSGHVLETAQIIGLYSKS